MTDHNDVQDNDSSFQRLIMEVSSDLVFVKDADFRIVDANLAFLQLYPPEQRDKVIGFTTLEEYSAEEADLFLTEDKKAFQTGFSEVEETIKFPDGQYRTLLTKKQHFRDAAGASFILGIARDITDRKQMILELLEVNAELKEFAYRTSHDLRSPLISSIKLLQISQSLIEEDQAKESLEFLEHAQNSLTKLELLVTDILKLSKLNQENLQLADISLKSLFNEAIDNLAYAEGMDRVTINLKCDDDLSIVAQKDLLSLVIDNLLSNAVKYQDYQRDDAFINITVRLLKNRCKISIEDNGLGIPKAYHNDIYTMFRRFHPNTSYGSGLGLYMVKKSIAKLNASIKHVDKQPGTEFIVYLPLIS